MKNLTKRILIVLLTITCCMQIDAFAKPKACDDCPPKPDPCEGLTHHFACP
jgi:hypothetical protein